MAPPDFSVLRDCFKELVALYGIPSGTGAKALPGWAVPDSDYDSNYDGQRFAILILAHYFEQSDDAANIVFPLLSNGDGGLLRLGRMIYDTMIEQFRELGPRAFKSWET